MYRQPRYNGLTVCYGRSVKQTHETHVRHQHCHHHDHGCMTYRRMAQSGNQSERGVRCQAYASRNNCFGLRFPGEKHSVLLLPIKGSSQITCGVRVRQDGGSYSQEKTNWNVREIKHKFKNVGISCGFHVCTYVGLGRRHPALRQNRQHYRKSRP